MKVNKLLSSNIDEIKEVYTTHKPTVSNFAPYTQPPVSKDSNTKNTVEGSQIIDILTRSTGVHDYSYGKK